MNKPDLAPNADRFAPLDAPHPVFSNFPNFESKTFFPNLIGLQLEEIRQDYGRMSMAFREDLTQPAGVVHGGAITALIDTTAVPALASTLSVRPMMLTLDLGVQFLAAATEDLICEVWISKRGRSICFCQAEVYSASGNLIATGNLTYKLLEVELEVAQASS